MSNNIKSIRPFIGAKDYGISRNFYRDLGFQEVVLFPNMSYFSLGDFGFYLQDYYTKDWVDNTMVFLEVAEVEAYYQLVMALQLPQKYTSVKLQPIRYETWGKEFFLHDPSGILWHIGSFTK